MFHSMSKRLTVFVLLFSTICLGYSGGDGTSGNPYQIANPTDWQQLMADSGNWNKCFILTADINLAGITVTPIAPDTDPASPYFQGTPFTGVFNGNEHVVRNPVINQPGSDYIGLFGFVDTGGQISHLGVVNAQITGRRTVGGLVGWCHSVTITSCYATGLVNGFRYVGGLVGWIEDGTLTSCYTTGAVSGATYYVGGLVGWVNGGTITSCYATGAVSSVTIDMDATFIGGLVGYHFFGTITSCYATGAVSSNSNDFFGTYVGGLVGKNYGHLTSCYATGMVSIDSYGTVQTYLGGLVGYNEGNLTSCYATGAVSGGNSTGGLVGKNFGAPLASCYATGSVSGSNSVGGLVGTNDFGPLMASFWDIQTSGTEDGVGNVHPDPAGVMGKTTAQMKTQSTFTAAGWDFGAIWVMPLGQYPELWPRLAGDVNADSRVDLADFAILAAHWLEGV